MKHKANNSSRAWGESPKHILGRIPQASLIISYVTWNSPNGVFILGRQNGLKPYLFFTCYRCWRFLVAIGVPMRSHSWSTQPKFFFYKKDILIYFLDILFSHSPFLVKDVQTFTSSKPSSFLSYKYNDFSLLLTPFFSSIEIIRDYKRVEK